MLAVTTDASFPRKIRQQEDAFSSRLDTISRHGVDDKWKSPLKALKVINAALLQDLGVNAITIQRDGSPNSFVVP